MKHVKIGNLYISRKEVRIEPKPIKPEEKYGILAKLMLLANEVKKPENITRVEKIMNTVEHWDYRITAKEAEQVVEELTKIAEMEPEAGARVDEVMIWVGEAITGLQAGWYEVDGIRVRIEYTDMGIDIEVPDWDRLLGIPPVF